MSAPIPRCRCGHNRSRHELPGFDGECVADGCKCTQYRPTDPEPAAVVPPARPVSVSGSGGGGGGGPIGPSFEQLLTAAKRSDAKRTAALAQRIDALLADLRARLADERQAAEEARKRNAEKEQARAEVTRLEQALAAARARLKGRTPPATKAGPVGRPRTEAVLPCPIDGCGRSFDTGQGLALHRRRAHEGFNPTAAKVG